MAEIGQDILIAYYDNGVKDGQHSGYWKGINALHEAILYYLNMPVEEIRKVFNTNSTYDIYILSVGSDYLNYCYLASTK